MNGDEAEGRSISVEQRRALRTLFASLPSRYEDRYAVLRELRREFHRSVGTAIQPALRDHVRHQPTAELQDRLALTSVLSENLEALGLGVSDPDGRPAQLVVDVRSDPGAEGYGDYRFASRDDRGQLVHSAPSKDLPELHIVQAYSTPESPVFRWQRASGNAGPNR